MKTNFILSAAVFNLRILGGFLLWSLGLVIGLAGLSKSVTGTVVAAQILPHGMSME